MTLNKNDQRVGVFGGSFNPLHLGHINAILTIKRELDFSHIRVMPAYQSPMSKPIEGPSPQQRLDMLKLGLQEWPDEFIVDDSEISRGGVSYTVDTIRSLQQKFGNLTLIVGLDQFQLFDYWKNFEEILNLADLLVVSRPGVEFPKEKKDFPLGLQELIENQPQAENSQSWQLKTGHTILFYQLKDMDISSTEIRKKLRQGEPVDKEIPHAIKDYIDKNSLYEPLKNKIFDYSEFTKDCASILMAKNAKSVLAYDVSKMTQPSEFTIIASGTSTRHTTALAENLSREIKKKYGVFPQNVEGLQEGRWVVLDYGSLIVHLFYDFIRTEYKLEDLWKDGQPIELPTPQ